MSTIFDDAVSIAQTLVRVRRPPEQELVAAIERATDDTARLLYPTVIICESGKPHIHRELYRRFGIA